MPITFKCQHCRTELTVKDELAGKPGKCPSCKGIVVVPAPKAEEVTDDLEWLDEEETLKKGSKTRKASAREEDDEEPPRRSIKKSSRRDEEDEDEDDRPARKKAGRRRDEDDEDDDDPRVLKKRKAAFRFAAQGVLFHGIGTFIYAGTFLLAVLSVFILAGSISSELSKLKKQFAPARPGGQGEPLPRIDEKEIRAQQEELEARMKKAEKLNDWAGFKGLNRAPSDTERRTQLGIQLWAGASNGAVVALGFLTGLALLAALGLSVTGLAFLIRTPGNGVILGLSIASLCCGALSTLCFVIVFIILLTGDGGLCAVMPFSMLNPFSGMVRAIYTHGMATWIVGRIGFLLYLIPVLELGRLTTFAVYQWMVGKAQRDRSARFKGFLMTILIPSVLLGGSLLVFCFTLVRPNLDTPRNVTKPEDIPGPWPDAMFLMIAGLMFGGLLVWSALTNFSTRNALKYGK